MQLDPSPILRFAAAFLWADLRLAATEIAFFDALAHELGVAATFDLLAAPPSPEEIDPTRVPPALAMRIRDACLRAIASDGVVDEGEMELFDLLDELLPMGPPQKPS